MAGFKESNVGMTERLWGVVQTVVRPARAVTSYRQLSDLINVLAGKNLVYRCDPREPEAIVLGFGRQATGYLPAKKGDKPIAEMEAAWRWMKEAEERAQEVVEEQRAAVEKLRQKATGLTPAEAMEGKEGDVFLPVNKSAGALIHVRSSVPGQPCFRITESVGLYLRKSGIISLMAGKHVWPNENLFRACEAWKGDGASAPVPAGKPAGKS